MGFRLAHTDKDPTVGPNNPRTYPRARPRACKGGHAQSASEWRDGGLYGASDEQGSQQGSARHFSMHLETCRLVQVGLYWAYS